MKNFTQYIKESEKDGKNGHYEDFVDEDTGEIVTLWVDDPDPELEKLKWETYEKNHEKVRKIYKKCKEQEKEVKNKLEKLEDEMLMNDNTLDAFKGCDTLEDAKNTYKRLAKIYHPDHGGSQEDFMKLKDRYDFTVRRIQRFLNCLEGLGIKF